MMLADAWIAAIMESGMNEASFVRRAKAVMQPAHNDECDDLRS